MNEKIYIESTDGVMLEAVLKGSGKKDRGVVVTHPHPLYGGSMDNPVVHAILDAYARCGFCSLHFNFRGVGGSGGEYGNGRGEIDDVKAACAFMSARGGGYLALSGYSFGTWVNAHLPLKTIDIKHMTMVSPPVAFMAFESVGSIEVPLAVVTGVLDEIAPPDRVKSLAAKWNENVKFTGIDGADHFYQRHMGSLTDILEENIRCFLRKYK